MLMNTRIARLGNLTFTSILFPFLFIACSSNMTLHITYNYGSFSCPSNATVQPKVEVEQVDSSTNIGTGHATGTCILKITP